MCFSRNLSEIILISTLIPFSRFHASTYSVWPVLNMNVRCVLVVKRKLLELKELVWELFLCVLLVVHVMDTLVVDVPIYRNEIYW